MTDHYGDRCALWCVHCGEITHGRVPARHPDDFHCSGCCRRSDLDIAGARTAMAQMEAAETLLASAVSLWQCVGKTGAAEATRGALIASRGCREHMSVVTSHEEAQL